MRPWIGGANSRGGYLAQKLSHIQVVPWIASLIADFTVSECVISVAVQASASRYHLPNLTSDANCEDVKNSPSLACLKANPSNSTPTESGLILYVRKSTPRVTRPVFES